MTLKVKQFIFFLPKIKVNIYKNFFLIIFLGKNYLSYVRKIKTEKILQETDVDIIKKYTFHDTWYCTKVNLLLASDSDDLKNEAGYIEKLEKSIYRRAQAKPVKNKRCFRGMHQSEKEFNAYILNETIYIPSFLSTSKNQEKVYMDSNINGLIEIKLDYIPNNAIDVNDELSIYSDEEEEVLFGCYSKFKVIEKKKDYEFRGKIFEFYIKLEHINQACHNLGVENILMMNFLGYC